MPEHEDNHEAMLTACLFNERADKRAIACATVAYARHAQDALRQDPPNITRAMGYLDSLLEMSQRIANLPVQER